MVVEEKTIMRRTRMARKEEEDEEEVKEEEMNGRREKKDWKRAKNKLQNIEILIKSQHKSKIILEPYRSHPEYKVHLVRRSRCVQPDRNPFSPSTPSHLKGHPLLPFNPSHLEGHPLLHTSLPTPFPFRETIKK